MKKPRVEPVVVPPRPCGFCGSGHDGVPGRCYDRNGMCPGTREDYVPRTKTNPRGEWTCACAAAGHYLVLKPAA
jgi:hypothetical protein